MKIPLLCILLALSTAPAIAQVAAQKLAPLPVVIESAKAMATVTPFISGLKEPQGLALSPQGDLLVADYQTGEILKFSLEGKPRGVLAAGLQSPAMMDVGNDGLYVCDRKANRVVLIKMAGSEAGQWKSLFKVEEPLGIAVGRRSYPKMEEEILVVAHTTSTVWQRSRVGLGWSQLHRAASGEGKRYGFRCLISESTGAFLMTDEVEGKVLLITRLGRVATFASGFEDPSGIAIGKEGAIYVAEEGKGGQLVRVSNTGEKTVVAEKLGRPRGILFLDAKTVLVSNRDGNIWKVALP